MASRGYLENYEYVFDTKGEYGGSQRKPVAAPSEYLNIVRKYHPDYTEEQVNKCLMMLKTEGCGYIAMINTVFLRFYGQEEEFKKHFGYPMYTRDGKLNFNELLVDFYCATDNHYGFLWFDMEDPLEDAKFEKGFGTVAESREWRFEKYMKDHGVPVDVRLVTADPKRIKGLLEKGPLVVAVKPITLYDINGKVLYSSDAGHAMTVTGVADNGLIRVSSWGEEYYIKYRSYSAYERYQQVIYRGNQT